MLAAALVGGSLATAATSITAASAATGSQVLTQATDPHGNVWLPGTLDGSTAGALDPGTNPASASYGHLWTTDVPSGFCRLVANPDGSASSVLDRSTAGGCITAGGKAGQPEWDQRRNADGTFYVYTPDWAVKSAGVYRLTYDPGKQVMTKTELLAPNRYPADNKPFDVQLGHDNKLYVSNDKNSSIARISGVNGPLSAQTVEASIATSNDGARARSLTFACWSNLSTLNPGGAAVTRAAGQPGCSPSNPKPDLVLAQKSSVSVVLNAETCQTAPGGCPARPTSIKVLTPMGLRTDPADSTVLYISDSPGTTSEIKRYHISTNIQDSYASYGALPDGSLTQFSFAFSVGFDPAHAMYVGDDPTAGATAFNGRYFRVAANAPADNPGRPGTPGTPPAPPSLRAGSLFGGEFPAPATPSGAAPTLPSDGIWLGSHLWLPDSANGLCRLDVDPTTHLALENLTTCVTGASAAGMTKPEQSAYDAGKQLLYVADGSSASAGVVRFSFDPTTETLSSPIVLASGLVGSGSGLDNQRADAVTLDPTSDTLYVGFRARNLGSNTQIARVKNASADVTTQTVDFIAPTTRTAPVFGLAVKNNPDGTSDLYVGDNKGVDVLYNVATCDPGQCSPLLLLGVRGPHGMASDGPTGDHLYLAGPPAPGTGSTTPVQQFTISTGDLFTYSSVGSNPDGSQQQYAFVNSLATDPAGNLYIGDNPNAVAPPNNVAHIWRVGTGAVGAAPAQPSLITKPANPTNSSTPTFAFSTPTAGVSFACSVVSTGTADAFSPCQSPMNTAPLADGSYTFKVTASNANGTSTPAVYSYTVDTLAPTVSITSPATQTGTTPSFTFSSTKTSTTFSCAMTPSGATTTFSACGSPQTYTGLPAGDYTFSVAGTDLAGNTSNTATASATVTTAAPPTGPPPTVTTPLVTLANGAGASTAGIPVQLAWTGTNAASYQLRRSSNGGALTLTTSTPTCSPADSNGNSSCTAVLTVTPSPVNQSAVNTNAFQVCPVDSAGTVGACATSSTVTAPAQDNTTGMSFAGGWSSQSLAGAYGGSVQFSSTVNAAASNSNASTLTGSSLGLVSTRGPDRGIAQITRDGAVVGTVDLYAPTPQVAQLVWTADGLTKVGHTVTVTVTANQDVASSGRRVDMDALVALR